MRIAMGSPITKPSNVTVAPSRYEIRRLCQKLLQMPEPESAAGRTGVNTAWNAGKATNNAGINTIPKKTNSVAVFLEPAAFE
jgi:hypothetical protein